MSPEAAFLSLKPLPGLAASEQDCIACIRDYDLGPIRARLHDKALLDAPLIDEALLEYRKFMILIGLSPMLGFTRAVPMCSAAVDEVWHAHILHTQHYAAFCQSAFGRFIHHTPATGTPALDESFERALCFVQAYQHVFGALPPLWGLDWRIDAIQTFREALETDEDLCAKFQDAFPRLTSRLISNR